MAKQHFFARIIAFFKKIFKLNKQELLTESSKKEENVNNFKQDTVNYSTKKFQESITVPDSSSDISEKNITMFLYKQVRLGNLEPKYIPKEYLEKVAVLLKEEKKIKKAKIGKLNNDINLAESTLCNMRKTQNEN